MGELDRLQGLIQADPAAAGAILEEVARRAFRPHSGGQLDVMRSKARFRIVRAGRRWGKTEVAAHEIINAALSKSGSMNWWVANRWKNTRRGYRKVLQQLPKELLAKPAPADTSSELVLRLKNGSTIEFYSGESPDSLAGEGVDFAVIDEAALIREHVWYQLIRPTLMDTGGRALMISTPRGRNWFWKLSQRGMKGDSTYESFHFRQSDNPYIPAEETAEAKESLPRVIYEQEIMAEFVSNAASIFQLTDESIVPELAAPEGQVFMGIDLAKKEDFTVISACNATTRLPCYHDKFQDLSWNIQRDIIVDTVREMEANPRVENVTVCMDSTGLGDVVFDHLEEAGLDVVPINFGSGRQKEHMVRLLGADLEHGRAYILDEQVSEFESYEYNITPAGRYKFEAASGHDDEVSAKMLEHWGLVHEGPPDSKVVTEEPVPQERGIEAVELPADSPSDIMARSEAWTSV
jgi:phage FluMu gp28-like protein